MLPFTGLVGTTPTTATMTSFVDELDQQCNELKEEAVRATELNVRLRRYSSIEIELTTKGRPSCPVIFPITTTDAAPEIYRRVLATLAGIVGEHGLSNVNKLTVYLPEGDEGRNHMRTPGMPPFLQSIMGSSVIQQMRINGNKAVDASTRARNIHQHDTMKSTDDVRLVTAIATNLVSPQSVLEKVYLKQIHFDDALLGILCRAISSRDCRLVKLAVESCRFPTIGPLWSALAVNQSIHTVIIFEFTLSGRDHDDNYGTQQLQSMLETNTTVTELSVLDGNPAFPNSFVAALGAGLASNTTLRTVDLLDGFCSEDGYITALFEGGLDHNIGLEKLHLTLMDLSTTEDLVSGMDRMAKNISTQRSVHGSLCISTLNNLRLRFCDEESNAECCKLLLDCLVRNSTYFALKELHFECWDDEELVYDASLFVKLAAFIQAFPTETVVTMYTDRDDVDDSDLTVLADTLENNTTMIECSFGSLNASANYRMRNHWNPLDNPNHTRILCSVLRNARQLPMFWEPSKTSLLPQVLRRLLNTRESKAVRVVNLTHAFHLIRCLPELFSTDGMTSGSGERVESVEN